MTRARKIFRGLCYAILASALCPMAPALAQDGWPTARIQRTVTPCGPARHTSPLTPSDTTTTAELSLPGSTSVEAAISRLVPGGYAGVWLDVAQHLHVGLVDTTKAAAALAALAAFVPADRPATHAVTRARLGAAIVTPARWTFSELEDWHSSLLQVAIDPDFFVLNQLLTGIDVMHNQLAFITFDSTHFVRIERTLARQGLPCGLARLELH